MQRGGADQLVAEVVSCATDSRDLGILAEGVVDLPVARPDFPLDTF